MKTIINWIGHNASDDRTLEGLFELLAVQPLDRSFEAYGDYLEAPVWLTPSEVDWAPDGSDGEVSFEGNFYEYSRTFSITTNDPDMIERFRVALELNRAMPGFVEQTPQPLMIGMLATYIRSLGIGCPRWEGDDAMITEATSMVLRSVDDDALVEVELRHDGATTIHRCERRVLKSRLVDLNRTRRPEIGVDAATILGCVVEALAASEVEMVGYRDIKPAIASGQMTLL
jgi:hypothetical protein